MQEISNSEKEYIPLKKDGMFIDDFFREATIPKGSKYFYIGKNIDMIIFYKKNDLCHFF